MESGSKTSRRYIWQSLAHHMLRLLRNVERELIATSGKSPNAPGSSQEGKSTRRGPAVAGIRTPVDLGEDLALQKELVIELWLRRGLGFGC